MGRWNTPEFGLVNQISLYPRTTGREAEMTNQIRLPRPRKKSCEFEGSIEQVFPKWGKMPCYLRLEAGSGEDPKIGEPLFRRVTNPIWIMAA